MKAILTVCLAAVLCTKLAHSLLCYECFDFGLSSESECTGVTNCTELYCAMIFTTQDENNVSVPIFQKGCSKADQVAYPTKPFTLTLCNTDLCNIRESTTSTPAPTKDHCGNAGTNSTCNINMLFIGLFLLWLSNYFLCQLG
ncbi:lymphocyte antigen 6E-like [Bombina bombina]|uniref:lymphocyte antigen 6E-like n=1 Tax=Bombina bombina TaxID=8345 RepID=UPI00235A6585|nr:lymphocyte antigen 6E-like [Bombina bombina]